MRRASCGAGGKGGLACGTTHAIGKALRLPNSVPSTAGHIAGQLLSRPLGCSPAGMGGPIQLPRRSACWQHLPLLSLLGALVVQNESIHHLLHGRRRLHTHTLLLFSAPPAGQTCRQSLQAAIRQWLTQCGRSHRQHWVKVRRVTDGMLQHRRLSLLLVLRLGGIPLQLRVGRL